MNALLKITASVFSMILPSFAFAQYNLQWEIAINGSADSTEYSYENSKHYIALSDSGNVYAACNTITGSEQDILITKVNGAGNVIWTRQYDNGNQTIDGVTSIVVDEQENLYVLGSRKNSPTDWDFLLIMYDPFGNQNWVYTFSSALGGAIDLGSEVVLDSSSNSILICGLTFVSTYKYGVVRVSSSGAFIDSFSYNAGTGSYGYPNQIDLDSYGNVYMTGQYKNPNNNSDDGLLIKLDAGLSQLWLRSFDGTNGQGDYYYDLILDQMDFPVVVGNQNQGTPNESFLIIKYDASGVLQWSDAYSATYFQSGTFRSVDVDESGGIYVTGESDSVGVINMNVIKYASLGSVLWMRSYCGIGMNSCAANELRYESGVVAAFGYSTSPTNGIISIYDTTGNVIWLHESLAGIGDNAFFSGTLDSIGNVYAMGLWYTPTSGNNDLWVQKYSPTTLTIVENENSAIHAFPNPTTGLLQLSHAVSSYNVFDVTGRIVQSGSGLAISELDLSQLVTGMYFVRLDGGSYTIPIFRN